MPRYDFKSPLAEGANAFARFLMERELMNEEALRRQYLEDQRHLDNASREREYRFRERQEERVTADQKATREREAALTRASAYDVGDVVAPEDVEAIRSMVPGILQVQKSLPSRTVDMSVDPMSGNAPTVPGIIQFSRPTGQTTFRGMPEQRAQAAAAETKREDVIRQRERLNALLTDSSMPDAVKTFIRAQVAAGDTDLPAALFETKPDTRSLQLQANEAHARGDTAEYQRLLGVIKETGRADDRPQTLQLTDGGYNPRQVATLNQIAGSFERSPLIRAADRTIVLQDAVKAIRRDPKNAASQMNLAYAYIQALDTYQSAVREGELQNLGTLGTRLQQLAVEANKVATTGAFMPDSVAKNIADSAEQLVKTIDSGRKQKQREFASRARVSGVGEMWDQFVAGFGGDGNMGTVTLRDPNTGATRTVERDSEQYRAYTAAGAEEVR